MLSNTAGLAEHIISQIDTIWSWDDHFRVMGALRDDMRALSSKDWSRCVGRLARQHRLMTNRIRKGR